MTRQDRINELKDILSMLEYRMEKMINGQKYHVVDGLDGKEFTSTYYEIDEEINTMSAEADEVIRELKEYGVS